MPQKKPSQLDTGMILANDVSNLDGNVLFTKGLELTERHIETLLMWGVPHVEIEGKTSESALANVEQFDPLIVENAERSVTDRFALAKSSHPAIDILKEIAVLEKAKQIKQGANES